MQTAKAASGRDNQGDRKAKKKRSVLGAHIIILKYSHYDKVSEFRTLKQAGWVEKADREEVGENRPPEISLNHEQDCPQGRKHKEKIQNQGGDPCLHRARKGEQNTRGAKVKGVPVGPNAGLRLTKTCRDNISGPNDQGSKHKQAGFH